MSLSRRSSGSPRALFRRSAVEDPPPSRRLENLDTGQHPPPQAGGSKSAFHRAELSAPREMQYRCRNHHRGAWVTPPLSGTTISEIDFTQPVSAENLIRVDGINESPKLAQ